MPNVSKKPPEPGHRTIFCAKPDLKLFRTMPKPAQKAAPEADETEEQITLEGYAIVWNEASKDRGGYKVILLPGSAVFTDPCLALYHHEYRDLLGNTANGTLRLIPDDHGVKVQIDLPDTSTARDVAELVEDEYLTGMSFSMMNGFEESTAIEKDGQTIVAVSKFTCDEVTVTVIPSFVTTTIAVQQEEDPEVPAGRVLQAARWGRHRLALYEL